MVQSTLQANPGKGRLFSSDCRSWSEEKTMRPLAAIAVAALAIALSGCVFRGQPKLVAAAPPPNPVAAEPAAPPAPPAPLSIPQTKVELPEAQPLSAEAMATI